ncbi:MAG: OB-fold domain-containing protein [Solirubrobacteraceae bacterium]|nr:OB-fold domain-containing protein [Solirubrobacteraceae bacterium]
MAVRPMVNRDSQFFWDGTQIGELRIQVCNACGAKRFPPGPACQSCDEYDRGYEVASGEGTVFSYVVHRHPPVPGKELPIVIALVDLDEGVRMIGEVAGVSTGSTTEVEIAVGDRLRIDYHKVDDELTLPIWRKA